MLLAKQTRKEQKTNEAKFCEEGASFCVRHESHGLQRSKPAEAPCQWARQVGKDLRDQRIKKFL